MFQDLRRINKKLSEEECFAVLKSARYGVLALSGMEGYPYGVPINYYYDEEKRLIYYHGSKIGHKASAIEKNAKVCFTVVGEEEIVNEAWAPFVNSVIIFGECHLIADQTKLIKFAKKYYPSTELIEEEIDKCGLRVGIYEISIDHISGKRIQEK